MRKVLITGCVFVAAITLLLGAAWLWREDLVRFGAPRFLPDELTLTQLEGLQISSSRLSVAQLEVQLHESGQRLRLADLVVGFDASSFTRVPVIESVTIGSAQLRADAAAVAAQDSASAGTEMRLGEVLSLLRDFPLAQLAVDELRIPWRRMPLSIAVQRGAGTLDAQVASGTLDLRAQFSQADANSTARLQLDMRHGDLRIGDLTVALMPREDAYGVSGSGALDVPDLNALLDELEQAPLPFPLRAAQLEWDLAGVLADDLTGTNAGGPQTFTLGLEQGARLLLPADFVAGMGELEFVATDRMELAVASGAGLEISKATLPLRLAGTWREQEAGVDTVLRVSDCALAAAAACVLDFDGSAKLGMYTLNGRIRAAALGGGAYELASEGLVVGGVPDWLPPVDVVGTMQLRDDAPLAFTAKLLLRDGPAPLAVAVDGIWNAARGRAEFRAVLPEVEFVEEGQALSAWFSAWPFGFDVLAGSVMADARMEWAAGVLTGELSAQLDELGGFYGDYFFRGLDGALQAHVDTAAAYPLATPPLTLSAAGFDVGLPMENLQLDFSFSHGGVLQVDAFTVDLLDGNVSGSNITYDLTRERNDVLVSFSGLEIERMMDLVEYQGVEASGAVSGELPLTLTPNGVEVAAGVLRADAPGGNIHYVAAADGPTGNAGLDLVQQALGNYQYDTLTSGIEYAPDGELLLSMKLEGYNPDMQNGQRINLNLNLSNNIPDLLESLQAARRIEDFLEAQYQ